MSEHRKVSIIMPTYNSAQFLDDSINSVINQTYTNWELIIIDDCSSDNTITIIEKYRAQDRRVQLFENQKNLGPAYTRNIGLQNANGEYIAFLDSDDIWFVDKLSIQISFMEKNKIWFSASSYEIIDENNRHIDYFNPRKPIQNINDLYKTCDIGCLTVLYCKDKVGDIFFPNIKRGQDYALWLDIIKRTKEVHFINEYLGSYRIIRSSISRNKLKKAYYQFYIYRHIEKLKLIKSFKYLLSYMFFGLKKNIKTFI